MQRVFWRRLGADYLEVSDDGFRVFHDLPCSLFSCAAHGIRRVLVRWAYSRYGTLISGVLEIVENDFAGVGVNLDGDVGAA